MPPQLPDIEGESAGRHYLKEFEFQPEQYWQYCGVLFNIVFTVCTLRGLGATQHCSLTILAPCRRACVRLCACVPAFVRAFAKHDCAPPLSCTPTCADGLLFRGFVLLVPFAGHLRPPFSGRRLSSVSR